MITLEIETPRGLVYLFDTCKNNDQIINENAQQKYERRHAGTFKMSMGDNSTGEPSPASYLHDRRRKREEVKEPQKHNVPSSRSPSERPEVSPPNHHQTDDPVN